MGDGNRGYERGELVGELPRIRGRCQHHGIRRHPVLFDPAGEPLQGDTARLEQDLLSGIDSSDDHIGPMDIEADESLQHREVR
jgi:hypothetical protein